VGRESYVVGIVYVVPLYNYEEGIPGYAAKALVFVKRRNGEREEH
jgi:hypothetical protein